MEVFNNHPREISALTNLVALRKRYHVYSFYKERFFVATCFGSSWYTILAD